MTDAAASTEAVEHERCESAMATLPSHSLRLRQRALSERFVNLESASLCDRDDLRTRIGQRLAVPVSELLRDC